MTRSRSRRYGRRSSATLYRLRANNQTWRRYRRTLVDENKWLAQRYGIGAELADFGVLARKPFGVLMEEIIELVRDEAMRLGCLPEVLRAREILDRGTSADRQLNVHARALADGRERARGRPGGGRLADRARPWSACTAMRRRARPDVCRGARRAISVRRLEHKRAGRRRTGRGAEPLRLERAEQGAT